VSQVDEAGFLSQDIPAAIPAADEVPAIEATTRARRMSGKVDEDEAVRLVSEALEAGALTMTEIDAQLADRYGVNVRTIRRLRTRQGLVSVSTVPAQS
jgi:hypothetical protein